MPSVDTLQQPHHDYGPSSEFHAKPTNLHNGKIQTLAVSQQAPSDATDLTRPGPPLSPPDSSIHPGIDSPGWKRLITVPLTSSERASLIATVFSDRDEVETVRHIDGDEAQAFIDVIYEVRPHALLSAKSDSTDLLRSLLIRRWIASTTH